MITTNRADAAAKMQNFRNHGISTDFVQRQELSQHQYAMESLGFNYRLTDIQCALGLSQLDKLQRFTRRRNDIARFYRALLSDVAHVEPLEVKQGVTNSYHLFVIRWNSTASGISRDQAFKLMREREIGVNVHYQPVYQHPFYVQVYGDQSGCCPNAERAYDEILSLPIFPGMVEADVRRTVEELQNIASTADSNLEPVALKVA